MLRFIDLFSGIGGMRIPFDELGYKCVFSSDWDKDAQKIYEINFGEKPTGDITKIDSASIPDHDLLLAGFPCQAFSIIGERKGFQDTRGTLFFDIARIIAEKRPKAFVLENVKQLLTHEKGKTVGIILNTLRDLGYDVHHKVLNALDYGLPQKRERLFIVGFSDRANFTFPEPPEHKVSLSDILETDVPSTYFVSDHILNKRRSSLSHAERPSIWHENKSGNVTAHPFSCALRAGASYNYILVDGERRPTIRELLRLMGFPESYKMPVSYTSARKLTGNSVCVPIVRLISDEVNKALNESLVLA